MCVTTNKAELFFNAFPIEKSYYFSSGSAAVRGTGKLSSYTIIYQPVDAVLSYDVYKALKSSLYASYSIQLYAHFLFDISPGRSSCFALVNCKYH